jgi:hypothetical protein
MEIVIWLVLWGFVGFCAAKARGWNAAIGFVAGAMLGPLALLLYAVSSVTRKPAAEPTKVCGQCAEHVKAEAKVCRYCGAAFRW